MFHSPFIVPVAFAIAWALVTWIRAHYGIEDPHAKYKWDGNPKNAHVPPMFQKLLEKAMAERDAEIRGLRERIEVLERIITDNHKRSTLADEIDSLRDQK